MKIDKEDCLKKALHDTQDRVRHYMDYAGQIDDEKLKNCFKDFAEVEGKHAHELQNFLSDLK